MYEPKDYWAEALSEMFGDLDITVTSEQLDYLAKGLVGSHECYGMAFYTPPSSDRYSEIEREWKKRLAALQSEFDTYRNNAESAVRRALRQHDDACVSIGEYGEVYRHDGRTEQIQ